MFQQTLIRWNIDVHLHVPYLYMYIISWLCVKCMSSCLVCRNVTGVEASATVLMALLVCVVAALLLSLVDFYQGFWAAWFCFVVATAHFSLVKVCAPHTHTHTHTHTQSYMPYLLDCKSHP